MIEFKFELDPKYMTHLKDKSYYNNNYYKLSLSGYGDFIIPEKCDILYQKCEDDDFEWCYYSLGYFEGDKFIACFTWLDQFDDGDFVDAEEK